MGIFTRLDPEQISEFLGRYDVGDLRRAQGIAQGVENTNYYVETDRGKYVLTIFEGRTDLDALPFFLELMAFLSARKYPCPQPVKTQDGDGLAEIAQKPAALLSWLEGKPVSRPTARHAYAAAQSLAELHILAQGAPGQRMNDLGPEGFDAMFAGLAGRLDEIECGLEDKVTAHLTRTKKYAPENLRRGIIHGDLFPDNVLFWDGVVSGVIDFYFACNDYLAYDLAVMLCAWSAAEGRLQPEIAQAIFTGYQKERILDSAECDGFVELMRIACLRFFLSRAKDLLDPQPKAIVTAKDPLEMAQLLDSLDDTGKCLIAELINAG